ncbi:Sporulation regulator WhiA [Syntrophomonas zehnderi OL-4]|uniref:Probable cell division protein WhiA n=1 Tax=Syntrophomonas zehnderi OL-4 TaxID=690567 RepID=A0A0E4CKM9_9FIRM|nr:DNA-binding protein WhiA [Syntrophomonas zehnderi]CQB51977.1 Sporulation regulator WhiA [Syntrophomonas zehnderi OL-4]
MSFANEVRSELAHIIPEKSCCQISELAALLALRGDIVVQDNGKRVLQVEADNASAARKVYRLLKDCCRLQPAVAIKERKRFRQTRFYIAEALLNEREMQSLQNLGLLNDNGDIKRDVDWSLVSKNCCKRSYLRGVFMCKGFINRPEGNYHLEIVLNDTRMAQDIKKMLARLDVEARLGERKNNLIVYIKDSEKIGDFLRVVEASNSLLNYENVRIIKSMRNQVNRQVNCETANLGKTIDASVRQVELIESLLASQGIAMIPPQLKELAMLRIDHPHSTLRELGLMMNPPLTKSGVAYRMRKLEEFAEETLYETE